MSAQPKYRPDVLASNTARRQLFIRWSKRNLVGVYVRGLNDSYGFRFAEHVAASQCVVAHSDGLRLGRMRRPERGGEAACTCEGVSSAIRGYVA